MDKFINDIVAKITLPNYTYSVVVNPDGFLYRPDTREAINNETGLTLTPVQSSLELRILIETHDTSTNRTCYLINDTEILLPDLRKRIYVAPVFLISQLLPAFDELSIMQCENFSFKIASYLISLNATSNVDRVQTRQMILDAENKYGIDENYLKKRLLNIKLEWNKVETIVQISKYFLKAIQNDLEDKIEDAISIINTDFQDFMDKQYASLINSSAVQKPKMVNKILPFLTYKHSREERVALIVIDGMSYWQFLILNQALTEEGLHTHNDITFAWTPTITRLSRQAIFKGGSPCMDYTQSPNYEKSLWNKFWTSSDRNSNNRYTIDEINYVHGSLKDDDNTYLRSAFVDVELDSKMHSSSTYKDLYLLTSNWAKKVAKDIRQIHEQYHNIYVTTDHGNIKASPWRNLNSFEKTFLYEKESKGKRHLIYSKKEYLQDFLNKNQEISSEMLVHDNWAIWRNTRCFNNETCITHGGAHFFEVIIPFITID